MANEVSKGEMGDLKNRQWGEYEERTVARCQPYDVRANVTFECRVRETKKANV